MNFEESWGQLSEALQQIYERDASSLSFEELYRTAYKMVLKKHGDSLYNGVTGLVTTRLRKVAVNQVQPFKPSFAAGSSALERRESGNKFLAAVKQAWEDHQLCLGMITDILMYLDRVFCNDNKKPSILVVGMSLFRDNVLRNKNYNIGADLNRVLLEQIQMEREGDVIDRARIRSCVYMLEGLYETMDEREDQKVYLTKFEGAFLAASDEFYRDEARKLLEVCDAATYIERTNERLNEEWERTQSTISTLTEPKIREIVERRMITENIREVMMMEASGLNYMIENDRYDQLNLLFKLVRRVDKNVLEIKKMLRERLVALGKEINKGVYGFKKAAATDAAQPGGDGQAEDKTINAETTLALKWVEDVLSLKDKIDKIWEHSFHSDQGVQQTISKAFAEFINDNKRSPEYISLFVDENIKKGLKGKTEAETDVILDKAIVLFRYIQDKDVFERYYKKHLSKRLILGRSISNDVERAMISKFKVEVGFSFTSKMEGMFKDMNVSQDLTSEYKKHLANIGSDDHSIDLDIKVLTSTFWPWSSMGGEAVHTCTYPPELEKIRASFQQFYLSRHNGRQLTWQPQMGTADIRATFKARKYEINVATYAMVILLQFNDPDVDFLTYNVSNSLRPSSKFFLLTSKSLQELKTLTSIPESELIRHLQALAVAPRTRVLMKSPMSRDVKPTDKFSFNANFTSKTLRIKIGIVKGGGNKVETDKERKETEDKIDESRAHLIEAAIVRTMKARKTLKHSDLILQITEQLSKRFMPDPGMIKKRIESLIEREYLERDAHDPNTYVYLA
ncbi:Cullin-3-A [Dactylella cylindrospora]|nr:Cullin-3-A [Dactylella cylindrospora]